ncbi:MAG: ROK family protein [Oscillospiraceae bacterium]|nr:ROK family protein [Oscillospiraceae bacterium]
MRYGFGVDILGTHIRFGFFEETGKLVEKWELELPGFWDNSQILPAIAKEVEQYLSRKGIFEDEIIGIGVGIPGPVSSTGVVNKCVNLSWGVFNIDRALSGLTGLHVKSSNTANLSTLGEYWHDSTSRNMVFMAMNSGLGGGIVCEGTLVNGASGGAGEIGHIIVNREETEACTCGKYGCVEQYCSPPGIVRVARRQLIATRTPSVLRNRRIFDFREVLKAAAAGDKLARDVMNQVYDYAGQALAAVCCVTNPDTIVLGGEFCRIGQPALNGISWSFHKYVFHANETVRFRFADLGMDSTIYGAFKLVYDSFAE